MKTDYPDSTIESAPAGKEKMEEELLNGRYRMVKRLGGKRGEEVYLAEFTALQSYRVLKILSKENPYYGQLKAEADILKVLRHPCIPALLDLAEDEKSLIMAEQYLEGESLKTYCSRGGKLSEKIIIDFAVQICNLLLYLHSFDREILYLDLQPENILVSEGMIELVDFGCAVFADSAEDLRYGFGTPGFAAPELKGKGAACIGSDIYAVGKILSYLYSCSDIRVCKRMEKIISRSTQDAPGARYPSAAAMKQDLQRAAGRTESSTDNQKGFRARKIKRKEGIWEVRQGRIGVYGLSRGTGTTHSAVLLSVYLKKTYQCRVALLEMNGRDDLRFLESEYFGDDISECVQEHFTIQGVDFWKNIGEETALSLFNQGYDYLVLDLGSGERSRKELLRCEEKLVIGNGAPWNREEWERWFQSNVRTGRQDNWHYLNALGGECTVCRAEGGGKIAAMPYSGDCLTLTEIETECFNRLFCAHE